MNKKIKLLIFAKSLDGGTGTYAVSLLKLSSFQIRLVSSEKARYRQVSSRKISYLRDKFRYPQKYYFSNHLFLFIEDLLKFRKKVESVKPDIVLGVESNANLIIQMAKLLFNYRYKTILTTHIDLEKTIKDKSSRFTYRVLKLLISFFYKKADRLVAVSFGVARGLKSDFGIGSKVRVIYNGIAVRDPFRKRKPSDSPTIVSVGRLTEQKDHLTLIKAVKLLSPSFPRIKLLIPSDGPLKKELVGYVERNNLAGQVRFLGWVKSLKTLYNKSYLFVLSTKREGFGYVLVEAMASSLPVVSSDVDYGPREILDNGKYGILVPPGNIRALAKDVSRLLINHNLFSDYAKRAYFRALSFSEKTMLASYRELILSLKDK